MNCKVCGNSKKLEEYKVKEMMFGFREEFHYFKCNDCNCLQILEVPHNISKYYPDNYYSFSKPIGDKKFSLSKYLIGKRNKYALLKEGLLGKILYSLWPNIKLSILSEAKLKRDSKILDVGCGSGDLLLLLHNIGLSNLYGIDPYLDNDIKYNENLIIEKKEITEINEKQDLIMFHHSFEHMSNPLEVLQSVSNLLNKKGYCIIRIPVVSSYAWEHYRENWVQLDAPRHFFLHSEESINTLASKASLEVVKIIYDSTEFQFLGSERYIKDIPLRSNVSDDKLFTKSQIKEFKNKAKKLNKGQNGDACAFILKKAK